MAVNPLVNATEEYNNDIPNALPHRKIYNIQVGAKLFKLSGASLSSDSPSYFTEYFSTPGNEDKTLFIDRSPKVFDTINDHLQGYYIVTDDDQFRVYLISDAYYFGLNKLSEILTKEIMIARVGGKQFTIPRKLISGPGNFPNYFSINNPALLDTVVTIERLRFIRPPPTRSPEIDHRSSQLFEDLLEILRGNVLVIKDNDHRRLLAKECRYYRFLELEQRIVPHQIIINPFNPNQEIIINIDDISPKSLSTQYIPRRENMLQYQRPYIAREMKRDLIFQIDVDSSGQYHDVKLFLNKSIKLSTTKFGSQISINLKKLFGGVVPEDQWMEDNSNVNEPSLSFLTSLRDCHCVINGVELKPHWVEEFLGVGTDDFVSVEDGTIKEHLPQPKKRKADSIAGDILQLTVLKSQWKMSFIGDKVKLIGVSFDAVADAYHFNKTISFLQ